jgi:hypothetical protein
MAAGVDVFCMHAKEAWVKQLTVPVQAAAARGVGGISVGSNKDSSRRSHRNRQGGRRGDDMDNIDEMDGATEAAPDQSTASARLEKLSRLQKACLEFCIALLDYQITRKEYDSPLVCTLAVLGVKKEDWKGPEQYLSAGEALPPVRLLSGLYS